MRKEYGKALRDEFWKGMKQRFPQFKEVQIDSSYFFPGDRAFRWIPCEPVHCWIILHPSKKDYDWFNVLVGWSRLARYPELSMVPCLEPPTPELLEPTQAEYLTRLPYFWNEGQDPWWEIRKSEIPASLEDLMKSLAPISAGEAKDAVKPLVNDALDRIAEYAIPYLQALRGLSSGAAV
jgi:hypothetical protein